MKSQLMLLTLIALAIQADGFTQTKWRTFKSTEENFIISLPAEPQQEQTSGRGPLGNGHHIYRIESDGITYIVSNSVFENPRVLPGDIKKTLDFVRNLLQRVSHGRLVSDKDISFAGFTGREVKVERDQQLWTLRAFVVKKRMYQFMTRSPKAKEQSAEVAKFFDSFKFINPPE